MFTQKLAFSSRIFVFCVLTIAMLFSSVGDTSAMGEGSALNALGNYAIVFVSRKIPSNGSAYYNETGSMPGAQPWSRFQVAAPGKLIVRDANGTIRTLIDGANPTASSLNLIDVNAPDVSYDATKIIFSGLPSGSYSTAPMFNPGAWRIYMINVDGTGLKQITFSDRNINLSQFGNIASNFTKYDDTDPAWLPDGRIVFSSTRWPSFGQYGAALTSNLYVINANGTNLHRITAERNGAERPIVDPLTGKIVYSRWWRNFRVATNNMATIPDPQGGYMMKDGLCAVNHSGNECTEVGGKGNLWRNAWHLATINPDGTGLSQFAGRSNSPFVGETDNHAYGGSFASDGSLYTNFFPMQNGTEAAGFGGIRFYKRGANNYKPIIGITSRDESVLQFVRTNPNSYGVYVGNYASEPEVLPDGRLVISWAQDIKQDYGLYTIIADGGGLSLVYDNPGSTELRTRLIRVRSVPPVITDKVTQVASALPPTQQGPYDIDGTFTFNALNVYFNAPVDANIISAPPVGSANTIRFFTDYQRTQQRGSFETLDWPILLKEVSVDPDGSVSTNSPANLPLFEQLRTSQASGYTVPSTGPGLTPQEMPGAAHVAGMNFGRTGEVQNCVGCHAGHTMISVPANPDDAQWTNLATGAKVTASSTGSGLLGGINDRRVKMVLPYNNYEKYWVSGSGSPTSQWVKLAFPVPVTVRTIRLYNIPGTDSSIKVLNTTVRLYSDAAGTVQVASKASGALSENGTDVAFSNVIARVVRVEFTSVNGSTAGLGEVEVIARAEADVPYVNISGNAGVAGVTLSYTDGAVKTVISQADGSYTITVPGGWSGTVTPSHPCYTFSPLSRSYSNVVANTAGQSYTGIFNPVSGCADIDVTVGGVLRGSYGIGQQKSVRLTYTGLDNGPAIINSSTGAPIIASERVTYIPSGSTTQTDYSEIMGTPVDQLENTYWFPAYDNVSRNTALSFGNVGTEPTTITITIGGVVWGTTYDLLPNQSVRPRLTGVDAGPVKVESSGGVPIIVSERFAYSPDSGQTWPGFSETNGIPNSQLRTKYIFSWYNNNKLNTQLRFANAGSATTTVKVTIGGVEKGQYPLAPNDDMRVSYSGLDSGPVIVESLNASVNIIASERVAYIPLGSTTQTGYSEIMGTPVDQLESTYWFPVYDNVSRNTALSFGNVGTEPTTITITIGGVVWGTTYDLLPNQSVRPRLDGVDAGPVKVESSGGVPIIVSERFAYSPDGGQTWPGFSETNGMPDSQLSTSYIFSWYNNVKLNTQVRFAVP